MYVFQNKNFDTIECNAVSEQACIYYSNDCLVPMFVYQVCGGFPRNNNEVKHNAFANRDIDNLQMFTYALGIFSSPRRWLETKTTDSN